MKQPKSNASPKRAPKITRLQLRDVAQVTEEFPRSSQREELLTEIEGIVDRALAKMPKGAVAFRKYAEAQYERFGGLTYLLNSSRIAAGKLQSKLDLAIRRHNVTDQSIAIFSIATLLEVREIACLLRKNEISEAAVNAFCKLLNARLFLTVHSMHELDEESRKNRTQAATNSKKEPGRLPKQFAMRQSGT